METLGEAQDLFALGVHIFRLLNRDIHPFACGSSDDGITDTQGKIDACHYAYGLQPDPRYTPVEDSIHSSLPFVYRQLFDRCFSGGARNRPKAAEWAEALDVCSPPARNGVNANLHVDMTDLAQQLDADEKDPLLNLLETCDREPREGLDWIARLESELQRKPAVLFAKFIALRQLMFERLFAAGEHSVSDKDAAQLGLYFGPDQMNRAEEALQTVAAVERTDPDYIPSLGTTKDRFGLAMVDSVCIPLERLRPGSVQPILGWTKLAYFGIQRVGFISGLQVQIPSDAIRAIFDARISGTPVGRSAVGLSYDSEPLCGSYVDFELLEKDFNQTPTIGDATMLGQLRIYQNGMAAFTPPVASPSSAPPIPPPSAPPPLPQVPWLKIVGWLFAAWLVVSVVSCVRDGIRELTGGPQPISQSEPAYPEATQDVSDDSSYPSSSSSSPTPNPPYTIQQFPSQRRYVIAPAGAGGVWIQSGPSRNYSSGPLLQPGDEVTGHGSTVGEDGVTWVSVTEPNGASGFIMEHLLQMQTDAAARSEAGLTSGSAGSSDSSPAVVSAPSPESEARNPIEAGRPSRRQPAEPRGQQYVEPAGGVTCILPSGQEAQLSYEDCREQSGVIYE
jgi:hypothetical protein